MRGVKGLKPEEHAVLLLRHIGREFTANQAVELMITMGYSSNYPYVVLKTLTILGYLKKKERGKYEVNVEKLNEVLKKREKMR